MTMIEIEVLYLMNDLLDRCELVLDIQTSETSTNRSELVMKSHCNSMHDVSFDARSSKLIIEDSFSKLCQKEKVSSNLNSLIVEQVAEAAQSSDIPVNIAEMIKDESNERESISYSPCEGPLFSDSESECFEIITEETNNKSENLKLLAHTQLLDSDNFPSLPNKLTIHKNVSKISNDKDVSSESDTSVHEEAEISDVQEIKGKKLEIYKNDWNGYNHSLPEDAMKIILPDVQNTIKLCTGNSTNKNIDSLGQVKNEYSVKALVEETDCCDITSEIQSVSQHGEQGEINLQSELSNSNINGMDSNEFVENAELNIDNPDNTDHYTVDSSNFDEVVSKTFSVKTIIDGYLDDVPCEVSSEQIVSNTLKSNYLSLFDTSITNTEEISENVTANDKQEIEAMNDVKIPFSSLLESTNSTDLNRTEEKFEDNNEPLIKYEIDTSAGNIEQLLIDSHNADTDRGCKKEEINIETKAFYNDHKTKPVSYIEEENKTFFEPNEPFEQFNNRNGTKHIKPLDCQEIKFVDQNLKPNLNKVQTTLNNTSFMKEAEVNETFKRGKLSSERSINCEKKKCAWNNADWKINDTLADKESCAKVKRCSDIHRGLSKSEMKLNSIEMFHKNVDIFHDIDSSILENSLFDGQNTCTGREQLSTLMNDSNLYDTLLESPLKPLSNNGLNADNDLKFMNTNSDINSQNSKEYISCVKAVIQDMSQSAVSCSLKELTSGGQDQENKSKGIFNDLCKSPLQHFSQLAEEDTSRETTVVKSDVYRSEVETPDAYIDLDGDLEDVLMYPATQCFKPSIVIGDRAETIEAFQSDNMNEFEMDDVKVPDVNHKRNISQVYSRNLDTSEIKKSRKENSLLVSNPYFKWNQTVPVSAGINGEEVISMKSLTCSRPLRLGLSKKQKTKTLHRN